MIQQNVLDKFKELFGADGDIRVYFAPGRVNLIGEHTDYNGGHVFPCALTIGTYMAARKRDDRKLRFYSMNLTIWVWLSHHLMSLHLIQTDFGQTIQWALCGPSRDAE